MDKLVIVHPAIVPTEAHLLYVAYEGWIYSGRQQWSVDKLTITGSEGEVRIIKCNFKMKSLILLMFPENG